LKELWSQLFASRYEAFTAVKIRIEIFWVVTQYSIVTLHCVTTQQTANASVVTVIVL